MKNRFGSVLKWSAILGAGIAFLTLAKMFARNMIDSSNTFGLLLDLLIVAIFIAVLVLGLKEIRDTYNDGIISFSKAYGNGTLITVIACIFTVIYMLFHYTFIEKDGLENMYKRNTERLYQTMKKETLTGQERESFAIAADKMIEAQEKNLVLSAGLDSVNMTYVDSGIDTIRFLFQKRMENLDSAKLTMANFDSVARQNLLTVSQGVITDTALSEENASLISTIVLVSNSNIDSISPLKVKYDEQKSKLKKIDNVLTGSLVYSFSVLLYGLFFNIFVSLYIRRKKVNNTSESTKQNSEN